MMGPSPRSEQMADIAECAGVDLLVTDYQLEWMDPEGRDYMRAQDGLASLAREAGADLIHLNSFREAAAAWDAPVLVVAHSCVWSWWRACRGDTPHEERWDIYADNVRAGLQAADQWVAPSAAMARDIDQIYEPRRLGRIVHNGIAASCAGWLPKERIVLSAGRLWDEAKNLQTLLEVAEGSPWPITVAGDETIEGGSAHTSDNVTFCGALPRAQLLQLMRRAAIYAAPAHYEPFGLSILEAASAGCALILSSIPSLKELWDGAALFIDPGQPADLKKALDQLCSDDVMRRRLQHAAAQRAARYSLQAMSGAYRALYDQMLPTARAQRSSILLEAGA
jgi:glycosyltransferase involved in cell wall biosynthesis